MSFWFSRFLHYISISLLRSTARTHTTTSLAFKMPILLSTDTKKKKHLFADNLHHLSPTSFADTFLSRSFRRFIRKLRWSTNHLYMKCCSLEKWQGRESERESKTTESTVFFASKAINKLERRAVCLCILYEKKLN